MPTIDIFAGCGEFYRYYWGYSASSCAAACSASPSVYVYTTCSTPALNCVMYGSDGNYATEGYYSDGTTCYSIFNDGQNIVRITATSSCCQSVTAINVFGTTILGEPTIDVSVFLDSTVSVSTNFDLTVTTDYGTHYITVNVGSGNSSGNNTQSVAGSGSDPIIYSYCINYVDNSNINCSGYACSGYTCPCG